MQSRKLTSMDMMWLGLALLVGLTIAFLLPVRPHDYWWYVRIGRDTAQTGAVPLVDTLSYTRAGEPIVYQSWLSALLFWLIYQAGGLTLTVLVRGVVIALAYSLVWWTMREAGAGPRLATLIVLVTILSASNNWSMRPQLFAYPLFAFGLWMLIRWENGEAKHLWSLPVVSLLWTNLHGSFVLLFLMSGAALVFGKGLRKPLGIALAAAVLVTLINPYGIGLWRSVAETFLAPGGRDYSVEWLPPVNTGWQMNIFFAWLLAFALLAGWSPRKLNRLEWIWFLGFGWLALSGLRYVVWFLFILPVLTAPMLAGWGRQNLDRPVRGIPALDVTLGVVFMLLPLALLPGLREKWWLQAPPALADTPVAATDWLAAHPDLPGPLWSDVAFSSYLTFALPSRPVWIDTRVQVAYPADQLARYQSIARAAPDWQALLDEERINLVMLSVSDQPLLMKAMEQSPGWCPLYRDDLAVIYSRLTSGQTCNG
jgi:hypothetical protein